MPLAILIAAGILGAFPTPVHAAAEPALGTAVNFAILAGSTITSTGLTAINSQLGLDPGSSVTGFPPGVVGTQHIGDAVAMQAKADLATAYNDAVATPSTSNLTGQDLGGMFLPAGVYTFNSSAQLTGNLTLTGPGVFIFQIGSTITTASNSAVFLSGGAQACAVYWQVGSSATLGTGTQFQGNLMALTSITMTTGANIVTGRAMAQNGAVTLDTNTITPPTVPCVPTPPSADIGITKTVDNPTPNLGSNVTFTITATNRGPDNASGVQVTDLLPAGLTLFSATPSTGTYASGTGLWTIGALTSGAGATLSLVATVTGTAAITNTATKTAEDQADPVSANNTASATITPVSADIAITKTVDNATPNLGSNVTFTITATNNGPSNATGVQVTDLLPAGLTLLLATPSTGSYTSGTGVWNIGALGNGASASLSISATVTGTTAVTNTATKTAMVEPDPVAANDSASVAVSGQAADIAISKTVDNSSPNVGSNVTFTITATNNGPSNATGVQVTDLLPAGLTFVSATPSTGSYTSGTGVWTLGALGSGSGATLTVTATVTGTTLVTNNATKTAEVQPDLLPGNDSASVNVTGQAADIAINKTVDNSTPNVGSNVTFTITATNNGPSNATGVQVTDLLPAGLTFVSATPSTGTYNSGTGVWNLGSLTNSTSATLSIVATVAGTTPATNTATKTAEDQTDPVSANNTASASINPVSADIAITKTVDNSTPNLGSNVTFTITATNNGPSNATGIQVTDLLPAGLTFVSATPSTGSYNSGTGVWSIGPLANAGIATLSITATVSSASPATNTASKTAGGQVDPVSANNSASASINPVAADIAISKTVDNPTPNLGSNVTFTVTATNNGPSNATGVQVTDLLPAGLTFVSATPSVGTYSSVTGVWNIGAMTNGASATLSILATATATATTTNTATETAEDQPDSVPANDSAAAAVTAQAADIAISKTVDNSTPNLGSNVTFTITATNNGPSNATGVLVTDLLPAGLTFVSATPSSGTYNPGTGVWNLGAVTNGTSATLSIVATVAGTTPVTNSATKTAEVQPDLLPGNDSASATVTGQAADIAIMKTVDNPTPNVGSNVTFTITATNNGPSNATGVQVTDLLPAGLTFLTATPSVGTYSSVTGVWNLGALTNGASATLSLVATATATVTNTATKTAEDQPDSVPASDSAAVTVTVQGADIGVTKTVNDSAPTVGQDVTYTLAAHNSGPSTAAGVQLLDILPAGVTFVTYSATQGSYDVLTGIWDVGTMVSGSTVSLSMIVMVSSAGSSLNSLVVLGGSYADGNASNNLASAGLVAHLPGSPGLPGLPNTSAPYTSAGGPGLVVSGQLRGVPLLILAVVAGLGVLVLGGVGYRRHHARFGSRRSRNRQRQNPGRLFGVLAVVLGLALSYFSVGQIVLLPAAVEPGTQLIGSKVVSMEPPAAPRGGIFQRVAGPIVPARLRIPSIGVDSTIAAVGLRADGSMDAPDNLWTSAWLSNGPQPGQEGNAVIAGHRGVGTPALFSHLENVRPGERINVSDGAGNELTYVVTRVASLDLSRSTQVAVFAPTPTQQLVLVTCFGRYIQSARTYDHRLVVFSEPLAVLS